jgi:succinate dehydrogenase hydrophobic anchor subunit
MSPASPYENGGFRPGVRHEVAPRPASTRARLYSYLIVRLTGLVLAVLVLGHFTVTHITTDVAETDAGFIARHWSSALWLLWDSAMLTAAMLHGAAGVWIAIEDYTRDAKKRRRRQRALVAISSLLLVSGLVAITTTIFT